VDFFGEGLFPDSHHLVPGIDRTTCADQENNQSGDRREHNHQHEQNTPGKGNTGLDDFLWVSESFTCCPAPHASQGFSRQHEEENQAHRKKSTRIHSSKHSHFSGAVKTCMHRFSSPV